MDTEYIPQLTFNCYPKTNTVARFNQMQASTDGGVMLRKTAFECHARKGGVIYCSKNRVL